MKGILKIYHPDETLKYHLKNTYCKAVYSNKQHFLEVEVITDDSLDHVDDDSLQYNFPQLSFNVSDFPIENDELEGKTILVDDTDENTFTEVNLFDDEEAFITENELTQAEKDEFILDYFGRTPNSQEYELLKTYEQFHNLLWCTWATMMNESRKDDIYIQIAKAKYNALLSI